MKPLSYDSMFSCAAFREIAHTSATRSPLETKIRTREASEYAMGLLEKLTLRRGDSMTSQEFVLVERLKAFVEHGGSCLSLAGTARAHMRIPQNVWKAIGQLAECREELSQAAGQP